MQEEQCRFYRAVDQFTLSLLFFYEHKTNNCVYSVLFTFLLSLACPCHILVANKCWWGRRGKTWNILNFRLDDHNTQGLWCHRKSIVSYFPLLFSVSEEEKRDVEGCRPLPVFIVTEDTMIILLLEVGVKSPCDSYCACVSNSPFQQEPATTFRHECNQEMGGSRNHVPVSVFIKSTLC